MKANESIEIRRAQNGFIVSGQGEILAGNSFVFESIESLEQWLRWHFEEMPANDIEGVGDES